MSCRVPYQHPSPRRSRSNSTRDQLDPESPGRMIGGMVGGLPSRDSVEMRLGRSNLDPSRPCARRDQSRGAGLMVTGLSASGTDPGPGGDGRHQAVARTADAHPERTALVTGERRISYAELDAAADCGAADLAEHGVCPGTHVPIMLPRSADLVIALLAVLKAGGVYAVLDPHWPRAQLGSVLARKRTRLVIDLSDAGPPPNYILCAPPGIAPVSATPEFVPVPARGEAPCCVFFTSGTTGRPKGVVVTHRSTARLFVQNTFARFDSDTVIPLAAAPPWDAFSLELWGGLLNGGTCVVVEEPFLSSTTLRGGIAAHSVNTAWITSSLFNMLVDESLDAFDGLRQVLVGGERLSTSHRSEEHTSELQSRTYT